MTSETPKVLDTYFFSPEQAYAVAKQQNQVAVTPAVDGTQLCYYHGAEPIPEAYSKGLDNLIFCPMEQFVDYFLASCHRVPTWVSMEGLANEAGNDEIYKNLLKIIDKLIKEVSKQRALLVAKFGEQCRKNQPLAESTLRIFLPASRYTSVMQFVSRNLAKAFTKLGCDVCLAIERNDREFLTDRYYLEVKSQFNPHAVVNINQLSNEYLPEAAVNIVWWQDRMSDLTESAPFKLRENDVILSYTPQLDGYLRAKGISDITREVFCVDRDLFKLDPAVTRENKVVFLGSSYLSHIAQHPKEKVLIDQLREQFESGEDFNRQQIEQSAAALEIVADYAFWKLFHYIVRDISVLWMAEQQTIPVEIYGWGWDKYPELAGCYKGSLHHGEQVAEVYQSARYALVTHPFEVRTQRLAEAVGCGAIPLVYDCRNLAEMPHWEQHCLYFKTRQQLHDCLGDQPTGDLQQMADAFSYDTLAQKLKQQIEQRFR